MQKQNTESNISNRPITQNYLLNLPKMSTTQRTERLMAVKEATPVFKYCARFSRKFDVYDSKSAIVYLKLKSEGCPKKKAKKFSVKNYCRYDVTKDYDGPIGFETLKIRNDPYFLTTNVSKFTEEELHLIRYL